MSRQKKDILAKLAIYGAAVFTLLILASIIGFILIKGLPGISLDFLTRNFEDRTTYISSVLQEGNKQSIEYTDGENGYLAQLGMTVTVSDKGFIIESIDEDSNIKNAKDTQGTAFTVKKGDVIKKIGDYSVENALKGIETEDSGQKAALIMQVQTALAQMSGNINIKIMRLGGGIVPMLITTLYMIGLSLLIAAPIGIISAVYLIEYAKQGKLLMIIHFAIENLAGIPSIIYGLFGSLFFVQICKMQYSILAGALTVSIILLPVIISTTEEALKAIPRTYRESSLGLGATRLQTVYKVVLPNATPGILVAILLSIGRIVGESAALLLTAGTVAQIPGALVGNSASGATLTIKAYTLMKEKNDLTTACAIGIILLFVVIAINFLSKYITKRFFTGKGA